VGGLSYLKNNNLLRWTRGLLYLWASILWMLLLYGSYAPGCKITVIAKKDVQ
jgi:hypothetical protein